MQIRSMLILGVFGLLSGSASADQITYTETFTASGSYTSTGSSATPFTNAAVTLSLTSDAAATPPSGNTPDYTIGGTISINIDGIGSDTITSDGGVYSGEFGSASNAGFFVGHSVIIATQDPAFNTYALASTIGPITNTALYFDSSGNPNFATFKTDGGSFTFTSVSNNATFQAVPEPSSMAMTAVALMMGGAGYYRRNRQAKANSASAV